MALGKVLRAQSESTTIPEAWGFLDRDGQPTTDPATALAGIIPAIGGYKGTGLAMVTNILAGVLSGSAHSASVDVGRRGQFFLLVDPDLVGDKEGYFDAIEEMVAQVRAAEVLPGQRGASCRASSSGGPTRPAGPPGGSPTRPRSWAASTGWPSSSGSTPSSARGHDGGHP